MNFELFASIILSGAITTKIGWLQTRHYC